MKLALSSPLIDAGNANEGFLRSGAKLAVVFLSDEDDCSDSASTKGISDTTTNGGNRQCHNDYGDGVDYKFARIDPVADYVSFLTGPIGGEVRDVAVAAIVGVDGQTGQPFCGDTGNSWCCGSGSNDTCEADVCKLNTGVTVPGGLSGATYCCGQATGTACDPIPPNPPTGPGCGDVFDKADRFRALVGDPAFLPGRTLSASICDTSFSDTLTRIACMLVPQDVVLDGEPAAWEMMAVAVKSGAATFACDKAMVGSANEATADVVIHPSVGGARPFLHFQNGCQLGCGKRIEITLICAG
jgi:hypothetical protein